MKTYKVTFYKLMYTIDIPVLLMFLATFLDIVSTWLFVGLEVGTEANPILSRLISISTWFIPIYLLFTYAAFVPFLSDVLRKTFGYTIGLVGTLLGLNNFSLVLFGYAFIIDTVGFNILLALFLVFGLSTFTYFVRKGKLGRKELISICVKLALFVLLLCSVQALFAAIAWIRF